MAILVTGGAGFIGSHLIERLLEVSDASIICLDDFNDFYDPAIKHKNIASLAENSRVDVVESSFCKQDVVRQLFDDHEIDEIIHLGAYAGVRPSIERPRLYQKVNVGGTVCLLEAARHRPVKRFILISSSTVYGNGAESPFREDAPLGTPLSPYGVTKRAAELMGLNYWQLHKVPVVILRPFSVYGPRLRPDLAMTIFTKAICDDHVLPLFGDGSIRRDFTHVRDFCSGLLAARTAEESSVVGQCINIGHSDPIEIRKLIEMLEEAIGRKARIEYLPENAGDMSVTYADLTKAEKLLAYRPQVPIEQGVAEFVAWFLQNR
ncbi:MAG: NAD-dependent epimerase/dehydratase family protein [Pirellulales bacterium]